MPEKVKKEFGDLLTVLQLGQAIAPPHAKTLTGYDPAVIELIEDHDRATYRAVLTVQLEDAIYVLHAFKKKSKHGIATSKQDLELITRRLKEATEDHEARRQAERREKGGTR